jgi:hypothetical protein
VQNLRPLLASATHILGKAVTEIDRIQATPMLAGAFPQTISL